MSSARQQGHPGDVVEKVLRRAEVAKMARLLQNRLALANFKTKHGWENLALDTIEPKVEKELKRKRPRSSGETLSDSSSNVSDHYYGSGIPSSSPLTAPIFSDDVHALASNAFYRKRSVYEPTFQHPGTVSASHKQFRSNTSVAPKLQAPYSSWKTAHRLPESSPVYHRQHSHFPVSHGANLSFVSETSTIPENPSSPFGVVSDNEDGDLPMHSFRIGSSRIHSSPPRTPPPTRGRSARFRKTTINTSTSRNPETKEEGADLLLYLATSPSPAQPNTKARFFPPSTPPSRHTALPSSMMSTPGGGAGFMGGFGGPNTPSQLFNFADFVNVTPSPAQGAWGNRTPATAKTPLAAKEARRRLNFDALLPPSGSSPNLSNLGRSTGSKETGLGMELGGELVS
ncbi:MAG: hypothetical protein M1827_001640 [Pycnora praestabilis]|nr:MAG: hypothetical protein M1827_001640 [Pycnora praestabilis]